VQTFSNNFSLSPIKNEARNGTTQFFGARNGTKTHRNPKTHETGTHEMGKDGLYNRTIASFMREYLNLGHMEKINHLLIVTSKAYYLAHHPVIKESSLTTKLRIVFDGSMKTHNGHSLNDHLLTSSTLDLFAILTRLRTRR
jgi:hypothetical protein